MQYLTKVNLKINPKNLSNAFSLFGSPYDKIPFQSFRGLINKTPNGKKGYSCYLISLFQLLFHIEDVKNYLNQ